MAEELVINVQNLCKTYKSHKRDPGFLAALKSLFRRTVVISKAVDNIGFQIAKGEIIGFVGQNGAGKSTTIKMLTGVLFPTSGEVSVLGFTPWQERIKYVKNIGAVFGQKSQLWWDIPPIDSFYLSKAIYKISDEEFNERLNAMTKLLGLEEVMRRPTRDLSLGERMKCEFVMALLHNPQVLFLDEPTIGVDALAKEDIREFLKQINQEFKTTIILTTHDMDDIEELCKRVILIDQGKIIYDGSLEKVKERYVKWKTIDVEISRIKNKNLFENLLKKGIVSVDKPHFKSIRLPLKKIKISDFVKKLISSVEIVDLTLRESRLEHVIKEVYKDKGRLRKVK